MIAEKVVPRNTGGKLFAVVMNLEKAYDWVSSKASLHVQILFGHAMGEKRC